MSLTTTTSLPFPDRTHWITRPSLRSNHHRLFRFYFTSVKNVISINKWVRPSTQYASVNNNKIEKKSRISSPLVLVCVGVCLCLCRWFWLFGPDYFHFSFSFAVFIGVRPDKALPMAKYLSFGWHKSQFNRVGSWVTTGDFCPYNRRIILTSFPPCFIVTKLVLYFSINREFKKRKSHAKWLL